jgi:cytochrome c
MKSKAVSMRRPTWKSLGWLLIVALASLPLIVCSGNKPSEQPAQPQPAASAPASPQSAEAGPAEATPEGGPAATGEAAAGKALFVKNCALCHNADSTVKKIGPGRKGLLKNKERPASHKPATEANVRAQIENGNPAKGMPAFGTKLSKAEIDGLIAYLKTI